MLMLRHAFKRCWIRAWIPFKSRCLLNWQAILTCFVIVIIKIYNSLSSMFITFSEMIIV